MPAEVLLNQIFFDNSLSDSFLFRPSVFFYPQQIRNRKQDSVRVHVLIWSGCDEIGCVQAYAGRLYVHKAASGYWSVLPPFPKKAFWVAPLLLLTSLISHALEGMRCSWVRWQGFIAGETQSPIHMNYSRPWNCFVLSGASLSVPKSQSCVPRPDWIVHLQIYQYIWHGTKKRITSSLYGKHSEHCLATDL